MHGSQERAPEWAQQQLQDRTASTNNLTEAIGKMVQTIANDTRLPTASSAPTVNATERLVELRAALNLVNHAISLLLMVEGRLKCMRQERRRQETPAGEEDRRPDQLLDWTERKTLRVLDTLFRPFTAHSRETVESVVWTARALLKVYHPHKWCGLRNRSRLNRPMFDEQRL